MHSYAIIYQMICSCRVLKMVAGVGSAPNVDLIREVMGLLTLTSSLTRNLLRKLAINIPKVFHHA